MCLSLEQHEHFQPLVKELHVFGQHGYGSLTKAVGRVTRIVPNVDVDKVHTHIPTKTAEAPDPEDQETSHAPLSISLFQPKADYWHTILMRDLTMLHPRHVHTSGTRRL